MTTSAPDAPLLSLQHLVKTYPGVRAVDDVSLDLHRGEVHGLVGENGAGKSTLIKLIAGAVPMDSGTIQLDGQLLTLRHVHDATQQGLAFIHQELNLVPYFDAAENIFLGHAYPRHPLGFIDWGALRRRAAALLARLGASIPLRLPVSRLSPGQQTLVAIARALAVDARLIVMDEPTAALTDQEIDHLFAVIRTLRGQGVAVVYVSHRLHEIFALCDQVTVMRNGRVVTTQPAHTLDAPALVHSMTGRTVDAIYPPHAAPVAVPLLQAERMSGDFCRELSFTLYRGEVLGIAGLIGAGRTELLRMLFGASPIRGGTLKVLQQGRMTAVTPRSPQDAFQLGIALAPEERRTQGLVLSRPIFENMTLTFLRRFARGGWLLDRPRELAAAGDLGRRLGVKSSSLRQPVGQLSGGNQQKVVFARCLAGAVQVLLLDEPTRGVDVGARQEVYQIVRSLTAQGTGVILVSSELPELLGLSDRVIVLREGRQVATLDAGQVDEATVLNYCYGITGEAKSTKGSA